jgi:hypothetical protein
MNAITASILAIVITAALAAITPVTQYVQREAAARIVHSTQTVPFYRRLV